MTYTVLGGHGYVGSHLHSRLTAAGKQSWVPPRDCPDLFRRPLGHVYYCIGLTADFRQRPHDTVTAHVSLLNDLLQNAEFSGLTYLSSTRVYAGADSTCEDDPLRVNPNDPSDLYNLTKLTGESICLTADRDNVVVARLSNVVGPQPNGSGNFIDSLVAAACRGRIDMRSARDSSKDYVHLADVVDLLEKIADRPQYRIYNVASGRNLNHGAWLDELQQQTDCQIAFSPESPTIAFPPIDVSRIRHEFEFSPRPVLPIIRERLRAPETENLDD